MAQGDNKIKTQNVSRATRAAMKGLVGPAERMLNKQRAYMKGKNPYLTIENPNKSETNKPYVRVKMSELRGGAYKDLQKRAFMIK